MTVIVGLVNEGKVWMGADRRGTWGGGAYFTRATPKLARYGPWMIGFAGNGAVNDVLRGLPWESYLGDNPLQGWAANIPKVLDRLDEYKLGARDEKAGDLVHKVAVLIGGCGQLYEMDCGLHLSGNGSGMSAIGNGADIAMGAMWVNLHGLESCDHYDGFLVRKDLRESLAASGSFYSDCGPPYDIWCEDGNETVMG